MSLRKTYLLWFAQEHVDFRLAEIESLLALFGVKMKYARKPKDIEPYWMVEFKSENDVKLIVNRSVSIRSCIELWAHADVVENLHDQLKLKPKQFYSPYFKENRSFRIDVETFGKHITQNQKIDKLETFNYLPVEGPVRLKNPDMILYFIEYYGTVPNNPPPLPYEVFFGRLVACGLRQLIRQLSLKTRKFIGNTSMDPQLSLLMANQAKVKNGSIVLDPFVGSGSLLVAAAKFGAYVLGTDIDYLMLHARTRPSRITQKEREFDESIKANMKQYNLEHKYLDVLINDFAMVFWKDNFEFDAIITDPPYGIREATQRVGTVKENYIVKREHLETHIPAKVDYSISNIYNDLLKFAAKHLRLGGRLVCWFPVLRESYSDNGLPYHPCLSLVANSEQILSKATSRRLLTFEKIRPPSEEELSINYKITDFRKEYENCLAVVETRKERRMKEARIRQENRLKSINNKQ